MSVQIERNTRETQISLTFELCGEGKFEAKTGLPFFDHMLSAFALHGGMDIAGSVKGDLEVDAHHTIEDFGIVLGTAFRRAAEENAPLARYGSALVPMDEALCSAVVDISMRPYLVYQVETPDAAVGNIESQLFEEFFRAFAFQAGLTLHLKCEYGKNTHHIIEALFKACGRALRAAKQPAEQLLSTKGTL